MISFLFFFELSKGVNKDFISEFSNLFSHEIMEGIRNLFDFESYRMYDISNFNSELIKPNQDFSFETTLSTRSFIHTIDRAKSSGYFVTLIFFWLESVELAKDRVKKRVSEGGHHIEEEVIKRRYKLGIKNLFNLYADKADSMLIFDNSALESDLIAEKKQNRAFNVYQLEKFNTLKFIADER